MNFIHWHSSTGLLLCIFWKTLISIPVYWRAK